MSSIQASSLAVACALAMAACETPGAAPAEGAGRPFDAASADVIYTGGTIITVDDAAPYAEALAVKDGRILAVGDLSRVFASRTAATRVVDLAGRTLVPGFIDAHGHFCEVGIQAVSANLLPPPDGPVQSIADLQRVLREFMASSPVVAAHGVVIGMNYDDSQLAERRHPTRQELDAVSTELPIMVSHQSGHFGVLNGAALAQVGLTAESVDPAGGVIRREADGRTPDGVLEENAFFSVLYRLFPAFTPEEVLAQVQASQAIYAANGFTTVQDGKTTAANLETLAALAETGLLAVDVVAYPDLVTVGDAPVLHGPWMSRAYVDHFRIGGVKLTLDGSPQGKTGWLTEPYHQVPAGREPDYRGYPAFTDEELERWIGLAYRNGWQVLAHCSGDAANDQLIETVRAAAAADPRADRRTVLIHGHFIRADQVPALEELGIFPSLFPLHTFNWGDWHRESVVGPERAEDIEPTGWLVERGIEFSIHADAPVIFPDSMQLIATAVNRTTRSGHVLGPRHRLEPLVALKAMTLWPAHQHFEERTKGSLEVGKLADLVILDRNPLTVDPRTIGDIRVVETIKEGVTVFPAAARPAVALTAEQRGAITWRCEGPCDLARLGALAGRLWTLVALNGAEVAVERPPTLQFEQGRASVFGGVNRLTAAYSTQADEVTFGAIASTKMAGEPALMELEGAIAAALARVDAFRVAGNELELSSQGAVVASFRCEP